MNDLGEKRGLSPATLELFNVRQNGTGWLYDFKAPPNGTATRWKSFYSRKDDAPENEQSHWQKYRWYPEKPAGVHYFYPPGRVLTDAIQQHNGTLWLVGGDIAGMTMFEAGIANSVSTFGDHLPASFADDVKRWGVMMLYVVPDRDESGLAWAKRVRDALVGSDVIPYFVALPYPLTKNKGCDVNDFWLESSRDHAAFKLALLDCEEWVLPEAEPQQPRMDFDGTREQGFIPEALKADLRFRLGIEDRFNSGGWATKNVQCPFHDDREPSATWNDASAILYCHASCGKSWLVKDLCEQFGLRMGDYYEHIPESEKYRHAPAEEAPQPAPKAATALKYGPPLPDFAQLTDAQRQAAKNGRKWLDAYMAWAVQAGPLSPDFFYEALGLWTLALTATRRMKVTIGGENIFPNLYLFIVAPTTVYRKTTALNMARQLIDKAGLKFLLMPERATPEALFDYLAGKLPMNLSDQTEAEQRYWKLGRAFAAQRALLVDEASGLLSEMKRDYNAGLTEIILQGYDGQGDFRKILKGSGVIAVRDMCFSVLCATTPIEWSRRMGIEERQNGFTARFAIITPEQAPIYREAGDEINVPTELTRQLWHFFSQVLPWDKRMIGTEGQLRGLSTDDAVETPPCINVTIAPEAMQCIKNYRKALGFTMLESAGGTVEDDKAGSYSRLGTMLIKVAMLLAGVDSQDQQVRIEGRHVYAAQMICERWRESLHRLDKHINESKAERVDDKVLAFIRTAGQVGVTARDIQRGCGIKDNSETMKQLKPLLDAGLIEPYNRAGKGRPAICYRVPVEQ